MPILTPDAIAEIQSPTGTIIKNPITKRAITAKTIITTTDIHMIDESLVKPQYSNSTAFSGTLILLLSA